MSTEFKRLGLPTSPKLGNTIVRIVAAIFSQSFMSSCDYHNKLKTILNKTHAKVDTAKLDEEKINSHGAAMFHE